MHAVIVPRSSEVCQLFVRGRFLRYSENNQSYFQMQALIEDILKKALGSEYVPGTIEVQDKEEFGHYTTPIAMRLAKEAEMTPRVIAENVKDRIEAAAPVGFFDRVEVAGPGFVNFW